MSEWIPVEFELPEADEIVLVCDILNDFITLGRMKDLKDEFCFHVMNIDKVKIDTEITHWMRLPKLPKVQNE